MVEHWGSNTGNLELVIDQGVIIGNEILKLVQL